MKKLTWKPIILGLGALLFLGGCGLTQQGDFFRAAIKDRGASIMDEGLLNAEWYLCFAASKGSVQRRYGRTQATADAYNAFCLIGNGVTAEVINSSIPDG